MVALGDQSWLRIYKDSWQCQRTRMVFFWPCTLNGKVPVFAKSRCCVTVTWTTLESSNACCRSSGVTTCTTWSATLLANSSSTNRSTEWWAQGILVRAAYPLLGEIKALGEDCYQCLGTCNHSFPSVWPGCVCQTAALPFKTVNSHA